MKKKVHCKKCHKDSIDERKGARKALKKLKSDIKEGKKEFKIAKVMHEFKEGKLHSGSKSGPRVKNPKQAIAIALSESRKLGKKYRKKNK